MSAYPASLVEAAEARRPIPTATTPKVKVKVKGGASDRFRDIVITALLTAIITFLVTYNYSRGELQNTLDLIKTLTVQPAAAVTPDQTVTPDPKA